MQVMSPDDQMLNQFANIARGTNDPGYWVYNLNYLLDFFVNIIEFVSNLAEQVTQVLDSIAWVRYASGNVWFVVSSNSNLFTK